MKLYYTTSSGLNNYQPYPLLSVGGYKSSSLVFDDSNDNFFGEISSRMIEKNINEYIGLVLFNDTGEDATDVLLHFEYPEDSYSIFKVAAVDLNSGGYMQRLPNINSKPVGINFLAADGEENAVSLGGIPNNAGIGIWLQRSLNQEKISQDMESKIYRDPGEHTYKERELGTEDSIGIAISWEEAS